MDDRIYVRIQHLINGQKEGRRRQLFEGINRIKGEFAQHNALHSSTMARQIYKLCVQELEMRATQIWENIARVHQTYEAPNPESLSNELKDLFKKYISTEAKELTDVMIQNLMDRSFAMFCYLNTDLQAVLEKHNAEIDLYVDSLKYSPKQSENSNESSVFHFYGNIGTVQTGMNAHANIIQNLSLDDKSKLESALTFLNESLVKIEEFSAVQKEEITEIVNDALNEIEKQKPNNMKLSTMLTSVGMTIQTVASAQPAYQALKVALLPLGITLP